MVESDSMRFTRELSQPSVTWVSLFKNHHIFAARRLGRLVAVAQESLIGLIAADHQVIGKLRQMLGGIG